MDPCCCTSLQTGTRIIAIVSLVSSLFFIVTGVAAIVGGTPEGSKDVSKAISGKVLTRDATQDKHDVEGPEVAVLIVSIVVIVWCVVRLFSAILLFVGAIKKNRTMCMVWFVIEAIGLIIAIVDLFFSVTQGQGPPLATVGMFLGIVLEFYIMWVVWAFMSELKVEQRFAVASNATNKP